MKGIILAGGSGTRLFPLTQVTSKQLLPIYDKPMIYYPLSILMRAKIKDILIISTPLDTPRFKKLLGNGSRFGITLSYKVQHSPDGIAQAFILGKQFIKKEPVCLILGDNIFYGKGLDNHLLKSVERAKNGICTIFGYQVEDPTRFGIIEFDTKGNAISIEEKPKEPKSNYCVSGLYFYSNDVVKKASKLKPSKRGEYEISELNDNYLKEKRLHVTRLDEKYRWFDAGTIDSLNYANNFIKTIQEKSKHIEYCPEEIAFKNGWINKENLIRNNFYLNHNDYCKFVMSLINSCESKGD